MIEIKTGTLVVIKQTGRQLRTADGVLHAAGTRLVAAYITMTDANNARYEVVKVISTDGDQGDLASANFGGFSLRLMKFAGVLHNATEQDLA